MFKFHKKEEPAKVSNYTKPKRKTLKIILFSLLIIILGVGIWVGVIAYKAMKNITSLSGGKGSLLSLFNNDNQTIKGQNDGRTNILLLGMGGKNHPGGALTDSIMVASINWQTKQIALISVPRDLYVQIPNYGYSKINEAYSYGEKNSKSSGGGGQVASNVISNVLGAPIHYFITLDFDGFKKIIDTVGGIDLYVDKAINDPLYPAEDMINYDPFSITAGQHHMNGALALKYSRSRETTSDFDRSERQQKVITATKEKILSLNVLANPAKVTELLNAIGEHLRTNMNPGEIKSIWDAIKDIDLQGRISLVLDTSSGSPLTSSTSPAGAYIIIPKKGMSNYSEVQKLVKDIFNDSKEEALKIKVLNGSGKSGKATSASAEIEKIGFTVSQVGNTSVISETIVYSCLGNKSKETSDRIAKILGGKVENKSSCSGYDIEVVIGKNTSL